VQKEQQTQQEQEQEEQELETFLPLLCTLELRDEAVHRAPIGVGRAQNLLRASGAEKQSSCGCYDIVRCVCRYLHCRDQIPPFHLHSRHLQNQSSVAQASHEKRDGTKIPTFASSSMTLAVKSRLRCSRSRFFSFCSAIKITCRIRKIG
jgi:hypothetical protein